MVLLFMKILEASCYTHSRNVNYHGRAVTELKILCLQVPVGCVAFITMYESQKC